jgi:hypothetical protein
MDPPESYGNHPAARFGPLTRAERPADCRWGAPKQEATPAADLIDDAADRFEHCGRVGVGG